MADQWIKLIGDRGDILGYVNRQTGDFSERTPVGAIVAVAAPPGVVERSRPKRERTKIPTPETPVEKAIAAIVENVQLTGRAPRTQDDEEV